MGSWRYRPAVLVSIGTMPDKEHRTMWLHGCCKISKGTKYVRACSLTLYAGLEIIAGLPTINENYAFNWQTGIGMNFRQSDKLCMPM